MSTTLKHLRAPDYRNVPWKNGGGSTTEIAVSPAGATVAGSFDWRISMARVLGSGPFSPFPGVERVIVQLSGEPMCLEHGDYASHELSRLTPYRFPGEWPTVGRLAGGEARDFNVMTRRGAASASVEGLRLGAAATADRTVDTEIALVFAVSGRMTVAVREGRSGETEAAELAAGETALIERSSSQAAPQLTLTSADATELLLVRIRLRSQDG